MLSNASSRCALPSRPAASCRRVNSEPRSARRPLRRRPRPGRVQGPRGRPTAFWRHAPGGPQLRRGCEGKARARPLPPSQRGPFPAGALRTMEPGQAPLLREPAAGPAPFPADGADDESKGLKRPNRPASEEAAGPARVRWRLPIGAEATGGRTQPRPALPSAPPPRPLLDHKPPGGETAGSAPRAGWVGGCPASPL